jgi:hypothetical protein
VGWGCGGRQQLEELRVDLGAAWRGPNLMHSLVSAGTEESKQKKKVVLNKVQMSNIS